MILEECEVETLAGLCIVSVTLIAASVEVGRGVVRRVLTANFCSIFMLLGVSGVTVTNPINVSLFKLTYLNTIR